MKQGRHVVFTYLPGYSDGSRNGFDLASQATGLALRPSSPQSKAQVDVERGFAGEDFGNPHTASLSPFPHVEVARGSGVDVLGELRATGEPALVRKGRGADAVVWYSSIPITNRAIWRAIFRAAGVHIYETSGDALHSGNGLLWIHTLQGGPRHVTLRNGKTLELDLPAQSTAALDNETGAPLF